MDNYSPDSPESPLVPLAGWSARWHPASYARIVASHPEVTQSAEYRVDMDEHLQPLSALAFYPGPLRAARSAIGEVLPEVFRLLVGVMLALEHDAARQRAKDAPSAERDLRLREAWQCHLRLVAETMRTPTERAVARGLMSGGFRGTPGQLPLAVAEVLTHGMS